MKNAGIFYLVIMILLSVMPCSDEAEQMQYSTTTFQKFSANHNDEVGENCSPICLCACCGQRVVPAATYLFAVHVLEFTTHTKLPIDAPKPEQHQNTVWNPPKI